MRKVLICVLLGAVTLTSVQGFAVRSLQEGSLLEAEMGSPFTSVPSLVNLDVDSGDESVLPQDVDSRSPSPALTNFAIQEV